MLIGSRNGFAVKPKLTAKSYVQDGLIAMWDGIENVGFGTHDGNSTTWTDLCRLNTSLPKFTLTGDDKWKENACEISDKHLVGDGYLTNYFITLDVDWSIATFEYCFTCNNVSTADGDIIMLASYTSGPLALINVWNFLRVTCGSYGNYGAEVPNAFNMIPYIGKSIQGTFSASPVGFAFRGEVVKPDLKTNIAAQPDFRYGFRLGALGKNLTNVHSVRIYSRTLTPAEMAHNYAIDKARFNLP